MFGLRFDLATGMNVFIGTALALLVGLTFYWRTAREARASFEASARFLEQFANQVLRNIGVEGVTLTWSKDKKGRITNANVVLTPEPAIAHLGVEGFERFKQSMGLTEQAQEQAHPDQTPKGEDEGK